MIENSPTLAPRIEQLKEKKLIGIHLTMSLADNKTGLLWKSFMPRRNEPVNRLSQDFISLQHYSPDHFAAFSLANTFEKWACVEVSDFNTIPEGMEALTLNEGLYAVFTHKGASNDHRIFDAIFGSWLPQSGYELDHRPHFEVLGEKYKNNDPDSEEEIWIPIKKRIQANPF